MRYQTGSAVACVLRPLMCSIICACHNKSCITVFQFWTISLQFFIITWPYFFLLFLSSEQWVALQTHRQHSTMAQSHGVSGSPQGKGIAQPSVCFTDVYRHAQYSWVNATQHHVINHVIIFVESVVSPQSWYISYLSRICVCAWWFATQSMELGGFGFVIGLLSCHCPDFRIGT